VTNVQLRYSLLKSIYVADKISAIKLGACERFIRQRAYPGRSQCLEVSMMIVQMVEIGLIEQTNQVGGEYHPPARYKLTHEGMSLMLFMQHREKKSDDSKI